MNKRYIPMIIAIELFIMAFCNACMNVSVYMPEKHEQVEKADLQTTSDDGWPEGQEEGLIPVDGGRVLYHYYGKGKSGIPEAAKWYISMTPNGELCVLPGCGHNASRERPVEFNAVVGAFADRASIGSSN